MTPAQRQHWEHQQRRAEFFARAYGAGHKTVRQLREKAANRLQGAD